jgi:threonine dehydratase
LLFDAKLLAEGAGAAATAAIISGAIPLRRGEHVAAVVSGGNVDAGTLVSVLERRRERGAGREQPRRQI